MDGGQRRVEYIPVRDYYHRHQRAFFWEVAVIYPLGNSPLFRYLLGWVFPISFQLVKLIAPEFYFDFVYTERHVLQDFIIPMSTLANAIHLSHEEVEVSHTSLFSNNLNTPHPNITRLNRFSGVSNLALPLQISQESRLDALPERNGGHVRRRGHLRNLPKNEKLENGNQDEKI